MKVVIATGLYPPEIGGPATYAAMLAQELPSQGIEVALVPFGWVRHYPRGVRHLVYAWKLWRESRGADLFYALDPISVGLPTRLVAALRRKPYLLRLGGDYAWEQGRLRFGVTKSLDTHHDNPSDWPWRVKVLAKLQTYVARHAAQVVVPSRYLKDIVSRWGIDPRHVSVIYSALYPIEVSETRDQLRHRLQYSHPTLISAGRLVPWKGFRTLIRVVAELREQYPHISLIIAGDGEERPALQDLVAELKLTDHVRFMGSLSKEALGASIKAADVFVLNTAYEGLSHQLIEVMDIGTPVVTTAVGGNPELIHDGVHGFLVPYDDAPALRDAIMRVLNHPESRDRIVQSARGRSKEFARDRVVADIVALLQAYVPTNRL